MNRQEYANKYYGPETWGMLDEFKHLFPASERVDLCYKVDISYCTSSEDENGSSEEDEENMPLRRARRTGLKGGDEDMMLSISDGLDISEDEEILISTNRNQTVEVGGGWDSNRFSNGARSAWAGVTESGGRSRERGVAGKSSAGRVKGTGGPASPVSCCSSSPPGADMSPDTRGRRHINSSTSRAENSDISDYVSDEEEYDPKEKYERSGSGGGKGGQIRGGELRLVKILPVSKGKGKSKEIGGYSESGHGGSDGGSSGGVSKRFKSKRRKPAEIASTGPDGWIPRSHVPAREERPRRAAALAAPPEAFFRESSMAGHRNSERSRKQTSIKPFVSL